MAWWTEISTKELLGLRLRVLHQVEAEFGATLKTELEDVVQHAFVVLFRRSDRVSAHNDGLFRYLKTVARRAAIDRIKVSKFRRNPPNAAIARAVRRTSSSTFSVVSSEQSKEENERIRQVFCALGDLDRLVIWSHIVDGKSIREVGRELGLNWHQVAAIIEETLQECRSQLEP